MSPSSRKPTSTSTASASATPCIFRTAAASRSASFSRAYSPSRPANPSAWKSPPAAAACKLPGDTRLAHLPRRRQFPRAGQLELRHRAAGDARLRLPFRMSYERMTTIVVVRRIALRRDRRRHHDQMGLRQGDRRLRRQSRQAAAGSATPGWASPATPPSRPSCAIIFRAPKSARVSTRRWRSSAPGRRCMPR